MISGFKAIPIPKPDRALAAYSNLGQVPFQTPPLHYHPLGANLAGKHAVTVQGLMRVIFQPTGDFSKLNDGTPDLSTARKHELPFDYTFATMEASYRLSQRDRDALGNRLTYLITDRMRRQHNSRIPSGSTVQQANSDYYEYLRQEANRAEDVANGFIP